MLLRPHAVIFVLGGVVVNRAASAMQVFVKTSSADCDKFVHCADGNEVFLNGTETGDSCHIACDNLGGNCCVEANDCDGFTGSVCADIEQLSCASAGGVGACANATIFSVVNSCQGEASCYKAGAGDGTVGSVIDSCNGAQACNFMASEGGRVGSVSNSCNEYFACKGIAYNGTVGTVTDSCIGNGACINMASRGTVGDANNSCNNGTACSFMAEDGGVVGPVTDSCNNGLVACSGMASNGTVGTVTDSCNDGVTACVSMAYEGGTVGDVTNSCNGDSACNSLAGRGGTVGDVTNSCKAYGACFKMANRGGTVGDVTYSCNANHTCTDVQCKADSCDPNSTSPGIDFMNGSCNTAEGCDGYMGDADGSGLTCTANSTAPVTFSSDATTCTDTDSEEISTCDGSTDVCTSLCPAGDAYIPSNYWVPPLDKPGMTCEAVRLKIPDHGEFSCLPIGEGICRDNGGAFGEWRFGIEVVETPPCEVTSKCRTDTETNTFPVLIDPANTRYPITGTTFTNRETGKVCKNGLDEAIRGCNYAGTTHICISENIESDPNRYSDERPYMFFYDEKSHQYLYQLVCDGIGEEGKLPELKMVNNEDLADATYVNYPVDIVKFKKGATPNKDDANELWKMYMDWNGFEDPDTRRIGKLASFIGVAHPNLCKEYVSATDKPCWKEDCNDVTPPIETPEDYERSNCDLI